MNKKVLIFWLGNQWKKYIHYFYKKQYDIYWVTKSWLNKRNINWVKKIYKFWNILNISKNNLLNFEIFDIIIVAVSPYIEQDRIIAFLIKYWVKNKVIIEKNFFSNFEIVKNKDNFYIFIDELVLYKIYEKIISYKWNIIFKIILKNENILHIFWWFLLFKNLHKYLDNVIFIGDNTNFKDLLYKIIYDKYIISCNKWIFSLNDKVFLHLFFDNSIDFLLNINKEQNFLMKSNFLLVINFLKWLNLNEYKK